MAIFPAFLYDGRTQYQAAHVHVQYESRAS